jgi:predicted RNA-binding protein with PIN domain
MDRKSKFIEIVSVDRDTVEKDEAFPEAYAFYINLSDKPDSLWERYFEDERQHAFYSMKREIKVVGDKLRLVFGYGDNIESHVKFARQLVEGTNKRIEEHYRRAEQEEKRELAIQEEIEGKKEEIRKKLGEL